jgi:hypothetical protein
MSNQVIDVVYPFLFIALVLNEVCTDVTTNRIGQYTERRALSRDHSLAFPDHAMTTIK